MSEHKSPIPSMIYNAAVGGHVTNSQQIIDENEHKEQSQINAEVKQTLGQGGSVDSRISKAKNDIIGGASSNGNTLKKIEDRILFGSDFSVNLLRVESYLNYYYIFDSSPLSDEFVHKIVSTNPMSFLGLKEKEEVKKKGMLSFFTKRLPNSNSSS